MSGRTSPIGTRPALHEGGESTHAVAARPFSLVVPVYNEHNRFDRYAAELARFIDVQPSGSELVFVDDGSTDGTPALVQAFVDANPHVEVRLVRRPHHGKGAAVTAGLLTSHNDVAAFCDLDLSTSLPDLLRIVESAHQASILSIGSRGAATSRLARRQARVRELLGRAYNRAVQLWLVPGVVDTQCGAKAATVSIWQKVLPLCQEEGFAWDVEVIAVARSLGIVVQEVGVEWSHRDGSKVNVPRDGVAMLAAIPRIRRNVGAGLAAPARADLSGDGTFDEENAARLAEADSDHWWFRSKAAFVSWCIRREARADGWLVDIGGGSGGVSALLGWQPDRTLIVEGSAQLCHEAGRRQAVVPVAGSAAKLPVLAGTAEVACLLDVIEHLDDPVAALREAARILTPTGRLIINVPAHPGLWSAADEVLGHRRRYTRGALRAHLAQADLDVVWMSHVFSWLAVPVWMKRRLRTGDEPQLGLDVNAPMLHWLSLLLARAEWFVVSRLPLPVGTSILCIARSAELDPAGAPEVRG